MKLTETQQQEIVLEFTSCESIEELVGLLNKINNWRSKNPYWTFSKKEITVKALKYFLYSKKNKYSSFEIPKKTGGFRTIQKPHQYLRLVQRLLNICLNACFTPMPTATGFITGRGIVDNAKKHINKKYVYNLDLENFFPSISFHRVKAVLIHVPPFKMDASIANIVANLCCNENALPQGAPTSPTLSNLICKRLDAKLYRLSNEMNFIFSRYADDITISCNKNIFNEEFKEQIYSIIREEGFTINKKKERLQRYNIKKEDGTYIRERQEVTGIIVNEKVNVSRSYIKNLRAILHNWEKQGYEIASAKHQLYYTREKGFLKYNGTIPALEEVVHGKIEYLGMVRGKDDGTYRLMKLQFDNLCVKDRKISKEEFLEIVEIAKTQGIKKATGVFFDRKKIHSNG